MERARWWGKEKERGVHTGSKSRCIDEASDSRFIRKETKARGPSETTGSKRANGGGLMGLERVCELWDGRG